MAKVSGGRELQQKLRAITGPEATVQISKALFVAGNRIQVEAQLSITDGAVSGKGHVPSRPGEPPKADTHRLADNIETVLVEPLKVEVSSNAPYAAALEYGTARMAPRPYMQPAVDRKRDEVTALVRDAITETIRRTGDGGD